jgi:hypothetical protein
VLAGSRAALASAGWIRGSRFSELLRAAPARPPRPLPRGSIGSALLMLKLLARLPGRRWRNTCLYRSVATCLLLRRHGLEAQVRIGVRSGESDIEAHAWVVRGDGTLLGDGEGHQPMVLRA